MVRRSAFFVAVVACLLIAGGRSHLGAQAIVSTVALGEGLAVQRTQPFSSWAPVGFSFGREPTLAYATAFARSMSGRIVAVAPRARTGTTGDGYEVLYTDDLGARWVHARWPADGASGVASGSRWGGPYSRRVLPSPRPSDGSPIIIAFDPSSRRGVAVTGDQRILSTEDEGAHWRVRRTASGPLTYAWIRGRTSVFLDASGRLWLSHDGGFALETLGSAGARVIESGPELLVVLPSGSDRRIDARGDLHGL